MEFIEAITGVMAVGLAFAGPPLLLLCLIRYELRKDKRN